MVQDKYRVSAYGNWWYGEVYSTWRNNLTGKRYTGWERVTDFCMTRLGALYEVKKWVKKNIPPEYNC